MVEWVFELLRKSLDLKSFFLQSVAKFDDFFLISMNLLGFLDFKLEVTFELTNLIAEKLDVSQTLAVLDFSIGNSRLQNLYLLVE